MSANVLTLAYALSSLPAQFAPTVPAETSAESTESTEPEALSEPKTASEQAAPKREARVAAEEAPAPANNPRRVAAAPEAPEVVKQPAVESPNNKKVEAVPSATSNPRPEGEEAWLGKHSVAEGGTFKPGTGFITATEDELFSMGIRARIQFRNETLLESEDNANGVAETGIFNTAGIRRARLQFKGHMWGKNNKYKAEFAFSPKDLGISNGNGPTRSPLLSFYSEHTQLSNLSLRIGQYKLFYSRQRVVSSGNQAFVDRTEAQGEFNLDRDIGFHFFSKDFLDLDLFKYYAGLSLAEGRDVWETEDLTDGDDASYQALARVEVLPFGQFKDDYSEVDFNRLDKPRLSIGAAFAYLTNARKTRGYQGSTWDDGGSVDYSNFNADVLLKWAGATLFTEFYWRQGNRNEGPSAGTLDDDGDVIAAPEARNGIGGSVQVDYLLPGIPVNVGVRYSGISRGAFGGSSTSLDENAELGGTLGWFVAGHPLKIQADYFHLIGDDYPNRSADRIRLQMQVAY